MNLDTRYLLSALRAAFRESVETAVDFRVVLENRSIAQFSLVEAGLVKSSSANGHSETIADEDVGREALIRMWEYLLELFDTVKSELNSDVDADIYAGIQTKLRPITGTTTNFMYLSK